MNCGMRFIKRTKRVSETKVNGIVRKRSRQQAWEDGRYNRDRMRQRMGLEPWDAHNGRKHETVENSKNAALILQWREEHPDSHNKAACARDLSMSRTTVTKWWNLLDEPGTNERASQEPAFTSFEDMKRWMAENLETVRPQYQMELTADEMMSALTNPDDPNYHKIHREVVKKE